MDDYIGIWPQDLDLRGRTVRLRGGSTVHVPPGAARNDMSRLYGHVEYTFAIAPKSVMLGIVFQNTRPLESDDDYDAVEVLESEAPPDPQPAPAPPATAPGVDGWWLVLIDGDRGAIADRDVIALVATAAGTVVTLRDRDPELCMTGQIRHTMDPAEVVAWLQGGAD